VVGAKSIVQPRAPPHWIRNMSRGHNNLPLDAPRNPGAPDVLAQQPIPTHSEQFLKDPPAGTNRPSPIPLPRAPESFESTSHTLNELLSSIVDLAAEFDADGKLLDIWSIDESLLFAPIDQILGKRLREMIGEEAYGPFRDLIPRVHRTGKPEEFEYTHDFPDGRRNFLGHAIPVDRPDGGTRTIRMLVQNITHWKKTEEHSRKIDALLAHTQELANVGSWEYDVEERSFLWSDQMYRMLGVTPATVRIPLREACALFHPEDRTRVWQDVGTLIETGRPLENELKFLSSDGTVRTFFSRAIPILNAAGGVRLIRGISQDVTKQREAQRALRESEEYYRLLVDGLKDYAIFTLNCDGYVTSWNPGAENVEGYTSSEILGRHFSCFFLPDDIASETPIRELQQALNDGRLEAEGWRVRRDGSRFWADVVIHTVRDDQGTLKGFVKITRDMTARRNAVEETRKRQAMLTQAEILANMGSWEIDAIANTATWSDHLFGMLGIDAPQSPAPLEKVWEIVHLENLEDTKLALAKSIQNSQKFNHIERYRAPNGELRTLHSLGIPITDLRGRTVRLVGTTQDITERTRQEDELRRLSHQLQNVRDHERRRITRELHETTVQSMAAMKMLLGQAKDLIPESNKRARTLLQSSSETADEVISQVRTMSHLLHPPLLDEAGLYPALRWYARGFTERSGISTKVEMAESFGRIPPETELAIFRVVQEALTNVHRHSGSADAVIRVERDPESVRVEVEDHGRGMRPPSAIGPQDVQLGVGTAGMRERVLQLDGQFEIKSVRDRGTTVCVRLPVF
jgi:PAS domain S-box-containing protein